MKIVELAFILLVFNFCMGVVVHSQLTEYPIYYESEFIERFDPETGDLPGNISTVSETQQYSTTMNIVDIVMSVTDFGWLYALIPDDIESEFVIYIVGLQAIVGFFYAVAIIELFVKRTELLGGSK